MSNPTSTHRPAPICMEGVEGRTIASPGCPPQRKNIRIFWDVDACEIPSWVEPVKALYAIQNVTKKYDGAFGGTVVAYFNTPPNARPTTENALRKCGVTIRYSQDIVSGLEGGIEHPEGSPTPFLILANALQTSISTTQLQHIDVLVMANDTDYSFWLEKLNFKLGHKIVLISPGDVHMGNLPFVHETTQWTEVLPPKEPTFPAHLMFTVPNPHPTMDPFGPLLRCLEEARRPLSCFELGDIPLFDPATRTLAFSKVGVKNLREFCKRAVDANVVTILYRGGETMYALPQGYK